MKSALSLMGDLFMILLAGSILLGSIGLEERLAAADRFFDAAVKQMECSKGAMEETCRREAARRGYRFQTEELPSREGTRLFLLTLDYSVLMPGGGYDRGRIQGYARY